MGLCTDFDGQVFQYFIAAATTDTVPDDLEKYIVPAATWAIFEAEGTITELIGRFWQEWLPSSGYRRAGNQYPDIEVYLKEDLRKENFRYELWFPVEKE